MPNEEEEVVVVKQTRVISRLSAEETAAKLRAAADAIDAGEADVVEPE